MQANDRLEMSINVGPALERNRVFAAEGGHEGAVVFPRLGLFVVTCSIRASTRPTSSASPSATQSSSATSVVG